MGFRIQKPKEGRVKFKVEDDKAETLSLCVCAA